MREAEPQIPQRRSPWGPSRLEPFGCPFAVQAQCRTEALRCLLVACMARLRAESPCIGEVESSFHRSRGENLIHYVSLRELGKIIEAN